MPIRAVVADAMLGETFKLNSNGPIRIPPPMPISVPIIPIQAARTIGNMVLLDLSLRVIHSRAQPDNE